MQEDVDNQTEPKRPNADEAAESMPCGANDTNELPPAEVPSGDPADRAEPSQDETADVAAILSDEIIDGTAIETASETVNGERRTRLPSIRKIAVGLLSKLVPSDETENLPKWVAWTKTRFFPDDVFTDDDRSFMETAGLIRRGNVIVGIFIVGLLFWAAVVPLDSAIVAHGEIVVQTHRKTIQHLEGGIVRDIRAKDGQTISAGQILVVLDDTQAKANLGILRTQVDALSAQEARLIAERDGKDRVVFPPELIARSSDPAVAEALLGEEKAFVSRKISLQEQVKVLGQRTGQNWRMIAGLHNQLDAINREKELVDQEVVSVDGLYKQGLATLPRLLALQRQAADLNGQAGQISEKIAQVDLSSGENNMQVSRVKQERLSQVVEDLRDVQTKKFAALDRLKAAEDTLKHTKLVSPVTGTVVSLNVHTVGAVVKPGETVMEIVPKNDRLEVEAQVRPEDVDDLYPGMEARVNFSAYKQRSLPLIMGRVETISADRLQDQRTGAPYFNLIASVDNTALKEYPDVRLMPGLPVEIEIATGSRTALQYLFSPLTRAMRHGMRER